MPSASRYIAVIDIGTNSIHMLIAEMGEHSYRIVDREKATVQLGLGSLDGAPLTDEAIDRGVTTLKKMAAVARGWKTGETIAVATSAVREAPNRREFLRRVKDETGIRVRVISGEEEADYIFRAVRSAVDLAGSTALCMDIGGGSMEFIVGTASEIYFTASEPLGALRLSQRFRMDDKPAKSDVQACRRFAARHLRRLAKHVRHLGTDLAIGTSGTIVTLTNLVNGGEQAAATSLRSLTREALELVIEELCATTAAERARRFGIDEKRAGNIVGGALVLHEAMLALDLRSLLACSVAMREGVLQSGLRSAKPEKSLRHSSAVALADRSSCDRRHAQHVARLALRIFDQTRGLHGLSPECAELLEHAALLHETGKQVSDRGYHKHSYYLIRHADLRGFTDEQLVIVANVARYHRKEPPSDGHTNLYELSDEQREKVEKLSSILRIAEALDRSHRQSVRDVAVRCNGAVRFTVRTRAAADMEIASAEKRSRYFADLFEKKVRFVAS